MRLALLPTLVLGALVQPAYAAVVDPIDPAAPVDPAAPIDPAALIDPAAPSPALSFDQEFFPASSGQKVDLSRFEKDGITAPGTYHGDVYVNKGWRARTDIVMRGVAGKESAQPCFDAATLTNWGVDLHKVATHMQPEQVPSRPVPVTGEFCGSISDYIPGASAEFDSNEQSLSLSVPQIYTLRNARGYVDPSQWDAGVNAGVLNYNTNFYRSNRNGRAQTSAYIGINASLSLGSWHLVHQGSASWTEHGGAHYQSNATYAQHDIPEWKAQAAAGEIYTAGDIFDSVRLRGARLYADQRMLPSSEQGYAPIVRGVATSNARVQVKQRGYVIYETTVAPGPFVIDDLFPTGYGGDLDVEVQEADGRIERFTVPYSAVPQLLRPGQSTWEVDIGKIAEANALNAPFMAQATYRRGLTNKITAYGGANFATAYHAILAGAALNTNIGAFSADLTQGRNKVPGQKGTTGLSLRVAYNKNIAETGTNFAVAAYRYSTSGFVGLNDAVSMRTAVARGQSGNVVARPRSRVDASIYQTLGGRGGQVYFSGSASNYWNQNGRQISFSAGYSNQWKSLSYSFSAQRTRDTSAYYVPSSTIGPIDNIPGAPTPTGRPLFNTRRDTTLWFTVSVPLGAGDRAPMFNAMASHSDITGSSGQAGISGSLDKDHRFNYNASLSHAGGQSNGGLYGQYSGSSANLSAGYSQGSGYRQFSAGASGAVVVHGGGLTLSPSTGDTIGLVYAPDAAGAGVGSSLGSKVDSRGYAVVPYLSPYQLNTVSLDPKGTSAAVELEGTTQNVAPRSGSVVLLKYKTKAGRALLIDSSLEDGAPIPFGADVFDENGNSVGIAGQASRVFVRGLEKSGTLTVRWGDEPNDSCRIQVALPPQAKGKHMDYEKFQLPCTQGAGPAVSDTTSKSSDAQAEAAENARKGRAIVSAVIASGLGLSGAADQL
ncbi:outer membrane usher protein [Dyella sp. OK004]|uniref:fimbria/pilus outer membrane usher protein n=1 Tax=Dyella sp. OK004 TaxID=1855292 RepID=UPI0008F3918E|nr:fimbria/pilus outer membrane usher protein [Dyella sp. OK004]SFR95171.1 outer membrane usher protein [Dyella sp. OK004]